MSDKASRINFRKGQTLVQSGKKSNGICLLVKGAARVQILDDVPASANVIAQSDVEAIFGDRPKLEKLFELFPHLASRFYRSLATNLSHRLRKWIEPKLDR